MQDSIAREQDYVAEIAKQPAYLNYSGTVPSNLLLELTLEDPHEDVRGSIIAGNKTKHQTTTTYSTKWNIVSNYEDEDPVYDYD